MVGHTAKVAGAGTPQRSSPEVGCDDVDPAPVFWRWSTTNEALGGHPIDQASEPALGQQDPAGQLRHPQSPLGFGQLDQNVIEPDREADFLQLFSQDRHDGVMSLEKGAPGCQFVASGETRHTRHSTRECCIYNYCFN